MNTNNDAELVTISSIFMLSAAVGMIIGNMIILPKLQEYFNDITILAIGGILSSIAFAWMSLIYWFPHYLVVVISGMLVTMGMITIPSSNGLVAKYLNEKEQGIGFGVIYAVRSITWIVAPITFALMYEWFEKINLQYLTFWIAAGIGFIQVYIILHPLKKLLIKVNDSGIEYSFYDDERSNEDPAHEIVPVAPSETEEHLDDEDEDENDSDDQVFNAEESQEINPSA